MKRAFALLAAFGLGLGLAPGCGGSALTSPTATQDPYGGSSDSGNPTTTGTDGGTTTADAAVMTSEDAGLPSFDDGTPTRIACSSTLGHGLTPAHGRLDGVLVSLVSPTETHCPSDPDHLHLQVRMNGDVYDIAVNLDGFEGEVDAPLAGVPYSEGWHEMDLDYVAAFGLHSPTISLTSAFSIRSRVEAVLTKANHISVYGTGYDGSDGAHLIHRKVTGNDGALVINPLGAKAHVIAFRFDTDTF